MKVSTRTSTLTKSFAFKPTTMLSSTSIKQQLEDGNKPSSLMQLYAIQEPNQFTINQNLRGMQTFTKTDRVIRKTSNWFSRIMIAFAVILSFMSINVNAQISNYSYLSSTSIPFVAFGGTPTTVTAITGGTLDDGYVQITPSPAFTFPYTNGNNTAFTMGTNGWLAMGLSTSTSLTAGDLFTTATPLSTIAAWWGDGNLNSANSGNFQHGLDATGTKYIFQWNNSSGASGGGPSATVLINFQIVLWGSTSATPGRIEIIYGSSAGAISTARSIGVKDQIGGAGGHYINAVTGNSTTTTTASSFPTSGQRYMFSPPPPCTISPVAQPTGLVLTPVLGSTTSVTGTFTAAFPASDGYLVVRTASSTPPTPPVNGVSYTVGQTALGGTIVSMGASTSFTATGLSATTQYWFWVYSSNFLGCTGPLYFSGFPLTGSVTTNSPAAPACPTSYTPTASATSVPTNVTFSWPGALGDPAITGYDIYVGTDFTAVNSLSPATRVLTGTINTSFTPSPTTILLAPGTQYFWKVVPKNDIGSTSCVTNSFTTYVPVSKSSTAKGGLWNDANTWTPVGVPAASDNVTIVDGSIVTINTAVTVSNLTIGQGGVGTKSILQWSSANALTALGDITIASNGYFLPYTAVATPVGQSVTVGGNFTNNGYANLAVASTSLNFNGSQLGGGTLSQTLNGTGTFEGDGTKGIIRSLLFQTTGSSTISTTQSLITSAFTHAAGSLNTNGKLAIDNTAQVFGVALNGKIASVAVTNMGAGYAVAPAIGPASSSNWVAGATPAATPVGAIRVNGSNVYVCTIVGTTNTVNAPTHGSGAVQDGATGPTWLWVGNTGTIGSAIFGTGSLLPVAGNQYFYGTKLFTCATAGAITGAQANAAISSLAAAVPGVGAAPGTSVVVGLATFICTGAPAQVTVNHDLGTATLRSLNLTDQGSGYINATAPLMVVLTTGAAPTTPATAIAAFFQQIAGPANSSTTKTPSAAISGGLTIKSDQAVGSLTKGAITTTDGGAGYTTPPLVGFTLPIGYLNLVTAGGSGYTTGATATLSGGTIINGIAAPSLAVVCAQGKVVSVVVNSSTALYTSLPTITITPVGGGSGATAAFPAGSLPTATAVLTNGTITNFNITAPGFGYAAAPTVGYGTLANAGTLVAGGRAAAAPNCRIGLYNVTYNFLNPPATSNPEGLAGAEISGAGNRVNALTMGSTASASNFAKVKLASDLELYAASSALVFQTGTSYGSVLNLNNNTLTCSNPNYAGTGSTGAITNAAFGYATNGFIKLTLLGVLPAASTATRTFPFDAPIAIATGTGTTAALGSTVTSLTVSQTGAPTSAGPKFPIGKRAYNVVVNAGADYGTNPTVTLTYNSNDSLPATLQQGMLYTGQAASLTGPWTTRSAAVVSTTLLAIPAASKVTATTTNGPIVPTGNDYFAWISEATIPTVTVDAGPYCSAGGQTVNITGTGFTNVSRVTFNGVDAASYVVNSATSIDAVTPAGITAGVVSVTANAVTGSSSPYTVNLNTPAVFVPVISNNGLICTEGASVSITLNDIGASSYTWTGGTGPDLNTHTGLSVIATPTTTTEYTVTALNAGGCTVTKKFQVGVIPGAALAPTVSQPAICFNPGATVTLNSNLSAGNFSVSSIPAAFATAPPTARYLVNRGTATSELVLGGSLDDGGWQGVPIGFNYNFFGNVYNNVAVGTNGVLMFGPVAGYSSTAGQLGQYSYNSTGGVFPNFNNPGNVISVFASDQHQATITSSLTFTTTTGSASVTSGNTSTLNVGDSISGTGIPVGALITSITDATTFVMSANATSSATSGLTFHEKPTIRYWTEGVAPTRRFILEYNGSRNYNVFGAPNVLQCILYETTGITEIQVQKTAASSLQSLSEPNCRKTIGLQDASKTIGATAPGRSFKPEAITAPEGWRFSPGVQYQYSWSPADNLDATTNNIATYTITPLTTTGTKNINLIVTNPLTGCQTSSPVSFTINPTPTAPVVSGITTVCGSGFTALTTNQPASGNSIKWYNDPLAGILVNTGTLYVTPVITRDTTFWVAEESNTCASPRTAVTITVSTPPPFTVNKPILCGNATSTQLSVTSPTAPYDTYIWSPLTNLFEDAALTIPYLGRSITSVYVGGLTPGIKKYVGQASSFTTLCAATDTAVITVLPAAKPVITATPSFICKSGSALLGLNATSALANGAVQWQSSATGIPGSFVDINLATDTTYNTGTVTTDTWYQAVIKNNQIPGATCWTTDPYFLDVSDPQVSSAPSLARCGPGPLTLTATAATGTINWYDAATGGTLLQGNSPSYVINNLTSTTPYWVGLTINGCEGTRTQVTATVTSPAAVTLSPTQTVCNNGVASMGVTSLAGNYDLYTWSSSPATNLFNGPGATNPYVAGSNALNVFATTSSPAGGTVTYTVSASNSINGCTNTATTQVTYLPATITASQSPTNICAGSSTTISLNPSSGYGAAGIQWQSSATGLPGSYADSTGQDGTTITTKPLIQDRYYQAVIKDGSGLNTCATVQHTVVVNNPLPATISSPNTRCGTGVINLTATAPSGTIKWYANSTGGTALASGTVSVTYSPTVTADITYYVSLTISGCEGSRIPVPVTVSTPGTLTVSSATQTQGCGAGPFQIDAIGTFDQYVWTPATHLYTDALGTVAYVAGTSSQTVYFNSATAGTTIYTVTGSNLTSPFCANTATSTITVTASLPITVALATQTVCNDAVATLSVTSSPTDYDNYIWSPSANLFTDALGTIPYDGVSSFTTIYARTTTEGSTTYTVSGTYNTPSCIGTATSKVIVQPASGTITSNTAVICNSGSGGSAILTLNTTVPVLSGIQWQRSLDGLTGWANVPSAGNAVTYNTGSITNSWYYQVVISPTVGGPCTTIGSFFQEVNSPAVTNPIGDSRCGSGIVNLNATPSAGATLNWYTVNTGGSIQSNANTYSPSVPATPGTYPFYVSASIGTCFSSPRTIVNAVVSSATPVVINGGNPVVVCNNAYATLDVTSGASNYNSFVWTPVTPVNNLYTNTSGTAYVPGSSAFSTVYAKTATQGSTTYTVTASNSATGCATTATGVITVQLASATASSAPVAPICVSGTATLTLNPSTGFAAGTLHWQSSPTGAIGTFTDIPSGTTTPFSIPGLNVTTYYRAEIRNSANEACITTTPTNVVTVNNPQVSSPTGNTRCGTGTTTLTATSAVGVFNWYTTLTGGTSLGGGVTTGGTLNTFTTPVISSTKTYYVGLTVNGCEGTRVAVTATVTTPPSMTISPVAKTICNGTVTQIDVTPADIPNFSSFVWTPSTDLYTDISALPGTEYVAGSSATTVFVKRTQAGVISYFCTASNAGPGGCVNQDTAVITVLPAVPVISGAPSSICTSGTSVLSLSTDPTFPPTGSVQWQTSPTNSGFVDIGGATSGTYTTPSITADAWYNVVIIDGDNNVCPTTGLPFQLVYNNPVLTVQTPVASCGPGAVSLVATASPGSTVNWYTNPIGGLPFLTGADGAQSTFTTPVLSSTTIYYVSANIIGSTTCRSERVAMTATVSTPPVLVATAPQTVCNGAIAKLEIISDQAQYNVYEWTPHTNLYTTPTATPGSEYTGGSATVLYAKSTVAGTTTYTINASRIPASCTASTTTSVSVQLSAATISSNPVALCVNGTAVLSLSPDQPYGVGSIQWERSILGDGSDWIGSPGAVGVTYTTPLQAATRYYRALVKDGTGAVCFATNTYQLVATSPQILTTTPDTKCGVQTATLSATATVGSVMRWYATAAGGTPLAIGGTFVTPVLSATTTYYVQASLGTCLSGMVPVIATITPAPALTVTPSGNVCANTVGTLTASSPGLDQFAWSPATNLYTDALGTVPYVAGSFAATVYVKSNTAGATTYTVTGSSSVGNCVNVATTTVTIVKLTINSVVASPTSVCSGNASVLTATGAGAYTYTWNPGNISGNPVTVNPSGVGITTYTVTATDPASGCTTTGTVNVTAIAGPAAPVTAPSVQCGYGIPAVFAVGTTNGNFRWYTVPTGGTAIVGEVNSSLSTYAISSTTTFYVSIYNGFCESLRTAVIATVNQPDAVTASVNNNDVCLNATVQLTATKAVGPSNYGYTWTASPAAGSGIPTTATGPVVSIVPTAPGTYVYTVTAVDGSVFPTCTQVSTVSVTVKPLPVISQASATPGTICVGTNSVLSALTVSTTAGTAPVGAGSTTTATYNAPFYSLWSNKHMQILVKASELTAAGLFAGNITSLGFPTTAGTVSNKDYSIKMGHTTAGNVASFVTTGLTQVYSNAAEAQTANTNNVITLNTPFTWDGTSNVIVEICFGDNTTTATLSSTSPADATSYVSVITSHQTIATSGATICPDISSAIVSYSVRPRILFGGQIGGLGAGTYNWVWNPGALSGNTQTVSPPGTTTYTVTATDPATTCTSSQPVTVTVNQLPAEPQGNSSSQCGTVVPTAFVVSQSGLPSPIFKWYTVPTGGTALQTGPSDTYLSIVTTTTTFYVSEVSAAGCESSRVPVTVSVSDADVVVATASAGTHCPGTSITLTATQTVVSNSYSYTWTASPEAGSGITGSLDGGSGDVASVTVTPTVAGTYVYTVTGFDLFGGCTYVATVTVVVAAPPAITSVSATPAASCAGAPVVLSALSVPSALGSATIGDVNSAVSNGSTGYPTPYANFYWGSKTQILIKASEMTAAGFVPGNITQLAFDVTDLNSVIPLINYTMRIGTTAATALSTYQTTGLTTVFFAPTYMPVLGINVHTFSTPFFWDGTSNILVDVCMNDGAFVSNGNASVRSTATAFNSVLETHTDNATVCSAPNAPNTLTDRPNVRFTGQVGSNVTASLNWVWNPGGLTGSTVTVNPTSNISYTVTATNPATGCFATSAPVSITVNPIPLAPTVTLPATPQCGFGIPTASVSGAGGTFKWYSAATGGTLLQTGGSTYATAISTTTTFYVSETSAAGCEGPRAAVLITVTPPDAINAAANLLSVCPSTTVQLAVSNVAINPANNYVYTWSATPASGSGMPAPVTGANQTVVPTVANLYTYHVVAFDAALGCTNVADVLVTVNPKPVLDSIRASQPTICLGGSSTLKAYSGVIGSGPQTAPTYCPDDNSGGSGTEYISSVVFNTLNNVTGAPAAPYTVTYPYSGSTTTTVSAGQTYTLTMTSALASIASVWIDYNRNGTYEASEWQQVWTSATSGSISITIPSNATAGATGMRIRTRGAGNTNGSGDACTAFFSGSGQDYTINVLSVITQNPAFTYSWTPGPLSGSTVTVNPIASTTYNVVATNPLTGCASATGTITVTVSPLSAVASATPTVSCSGSPVVLDATPTGGAPFTYIWSVGATTIGNTKSITVNPTSNTTYTVTVSDACNNITTATATVTINPLPTSSIAQTGPISICDPATQLLTAVSNAASPSYQWSLNGTPISGATSASYTVSGLTSNGVYTVRVTDGNTTCLSPVSTGVSVAINPLPSAVTVSPANPAATCAGSIIPLTATGGTLPGNVIVGTGTDQNGITTTTNMPPYGNYYTGNRHQILVRASELSTLGLIAGSSISSLAFDVVSNSNALGYKDFTIRLGHTNALALSTTFLTDPTTQVYYSPNFNPSTGWSTHTFSSPFIWDGTSNIVVETYFSNCAVTVASSCGGTTCTGAGSGVTYTQNAVTNQSVTDFPSHAFYYSDAAGCNPQSQTTATSLVSERPNIRFVATLPTSIAWSPIGGLYTDAGATVPYTGGPATVVYAKPVAGTYTYTATATSSNNCPGVSAGTSTFTIKPVPAAPGITVTPNGNGTTTLAATTYTGSLLWNTGATTPSIVINTSGTYTLTQTINGCTSIASTVSFSLPPAITADPALGQMDITDLGDVSQNANTLAFGPVYKLKLPVYNFEQDNPVPSGATTLTVDLGTKMTINPGFNLSTVLPGYYTWTVATVSGHQILTGDQIADLPGDFDQVAVFDVIGTLSCTSSITSTMIVDNHASILTLVDLVTNNNLAILQYNLPVTVSATSTNVLCNGAANGTITVTASPGTTITVNGNPYNPLANYGPGTYTIVASAAGDNPPGNTCSATTSVTITEPTPLTATIFAQTNVVGCYGDLTGAAAVLAGGGTAPYTYSWNTTPVQTTTIATGLGGGTYTVTVTDANGCIATATVTITQPPQLIATITGQTNVDCNGNSTGAATVSATGGTPGYTYSWNTVPVQTGTTATGLVAGTYIVTVTDTHGCTATATVVITEPDVLVATASRTNVTCNGANNGTATVVVTGGTSPYTYLWTDGLGQTTATATGLAPGTYSVTVTDAHGCVTTSNSVTVTQPAVLTATATATNVNCFNAADGTATVVVTGGTSPYTYLWTDGLGQTTATATGLAPGTYSVTVTDANGCVALSNTVTIVQPIQVTVSGVPTNVSCFAASNGSIAVTNSVGSTVVITNSLNVDVTASNGSYGPGVYTLTATAPNGNGNGFCTATATVTITEPIEVTVSGVPTNVTCFGASNGSIAVTNSVGSTVVITNSLNVDVTASNGSYGPGTYTLTATAPNGNANGFCTATATVVITEPNLLTIAVLNSTNNTCHGGSTGTISVAAAGGTTAYTYTISGPVNTTGATTGTFTGLAAGTYTITVTDANGCTAVSSSVIVTQPAGLLPDISLGADLIDNFFGSNGTTKTIVYNIAEIAGNPAVGDTLRITKVAGYTFSFNSSLTVNPVGVNALDNPRWKIDNSNPAFVSLIFDPAHNSTPGMLNCGERVYVAIDLTRNTPNISTFTLSARLRRANNESNLGNNLFSIVFLAE